MTGRSVVHLVVVVVDVVDEKKALVSLNDDGRRSIGKCITQASEAQALRTRISLVRFLVEEETHTHTHGEQRDDDDDNVVERERNREFSFYAIRLNILGVLYPLFLVPRAITTSAQKRRITSTGMGGWVTMPHCVFVH